MRRARPSTLLLLAGLFALPSALRAQEATPDVAGAVLGRDALFWKAYNDCALAGMADFFTADVEFYHDRGGITLGAANLVASVRDHLCSTPELRVRRAAVEGTVQVFPLRNGSTVYGAVLAGEHLFYLLEKGKPERLDGRARFTHLWLLKDGAWKMARILSYEHGPAAPPR